MKTIACFLLFVSCAFAQWWTFYEYLSTDTTCSNPIAWGSDPGTRGQYGVCYNSTDGYHANLCPAASLTTASRPGNLTSYKCGSDSTCAPSSCVEDYTEAPFTAYNPDYGACLATICTAAPHYPMPGSDFNAVWYADAACTEVSRTYSQISGLCDDFSTRLVINTTANEARYIKYTYKNCTGPIISNEPYNLDGQCHAVYSVADYYYGRYYKSTYGVGRATPVAGSVQYLPGQTTAVSTPSRTTSAGAMVGPQTAAVAAGLAVFAGLLL